MHKNKFTYRSPVEGFLWNPSSCLTATVGPTTSSFLSRRNRKTSTKFERDLHTNILWITSSECNIVVQREYWCQPSTSSTLHSNENTREIYINKSTAAMLLSRKRWWRSGLTCKTKLTRLLLFAKVVFGVRLPPRSQATTTMTEEEDLPSFLLVSSF